MKTKSKFITELVDNAQTNIWKNELTIKYHEAGLASNATPLNIDAVKEMIKRDQEYIDFLKSCE